QQDLVIDKARDATKQWNTELEAVRKHGEEIQKAMEMAFKPAEQALDDLLTKGTIDFAKLGQSAMLDLAHLAEKQGEQSLISAVTGRSADSAIAGSKAVFDKDSAIKAAGLDTLQTSTTSASTQLGVMTGAAQAAADALGELAVASSGAAAGGAGS